MHRMTSLLHLFSTTWYYVVFFPQTSTHHATGSNVCDAFVLCDLADLRASTSRLNDPLRPRRAHLLEPARSQLLSAASRPLNQAFVGWLVRPIHTNHSAPSRVSSELNRDNASIGVAHTVRAAPPERDLGHAICDRRNGGAARPGKYRYVCPLSASWNHLAGNVIDADNANG